MIEDDSQSEWIPAEKDAWMGPEDDAWIRPKDGAWMRLKNGKVVVMWIPMIVKINDYHCRNAGTGEVNK